jgi:hypothetical protein
MPFIFEIDYPEGGKGEWLLLFLGRHYQLGDGSTQMIEEQAAWCETCGRIIAAEHLRPLPDLERELAELRSGSGPMHDWLRALGIPVEREIGEKRLGWRRQRSSSARCLECGSEAIVPLPSEGLGLAAVPTAILVRLRPSYCHSCLLVPSEALKYRVLPTAVRSDGSEPPNPGLISLRRTVPAAVPSVVHSSRPYSSPSLAAK